MRNICKLLLMVLVVVIFSGCGNSSSDDSSPIPAPSPVEQTKNVVMVYMYGTDLESNYGAATQNILRMMDAQFSRNVKVVIQTGAGDIKYSDDGISASFADSNTYASLPAAERANLPVQDWTRVQRYEIGTGKAALLEDVGESCIESSKEGCVDIGTTTSLKNFINFTKANYEADRYILVLWNHGGGPLYCYGGASGRASRLTVPQILAAVKESDIEVFDILGFDACLMASAEIAHSFRNHAKVFVGSDEVEPGDGCDYKGFIELIESNSDVPAFKIGKEIANGFIAYNKSSDDITFSVTDLTDSKTDDIVKAIDDISLQLLNAFNADKQKIWVDIFTARSSAREYNYSIIDNDNINLVDLYDFFEKISLMFNGSVSSHAVEAAVVNAVDYSVASTSYQEGTHGLSIWVPYHFDANIGYELNMYKDLYGYKDDPSTNPTQDNSLNFSQNYITLIDALLTHYNTTERIFKFDSLPVQVGSTIQLSVESNFGIESAVLIADMDPEEEGIQAASSVAAQIGLTETPFVYELVAESNDHLFAYADENSGALYPVFMYFQNAINTQYHFKLPVYYQSESDNSEFELGSVDVVYDSSLNKVAITPIFYPENYKGKNEIELDTGDKLQLADVTIGADGTVDYSESGDTVIIEFDEYGANNFDIQLVPTPNPATVYAFAIQSLANEIIYSPFFNESGEIQP